jgi:hypothetical protein
MPFVKQTVEYAKSSGRSSVTVLGDMGSFSYYGKEDDLIGWEIKLPHKFEIDLKGFCLYHKKDYEIRLSKGDKLKLSRHHSKTIHLLSHSIPQVSPLRYHLDNEHRFNKNEIRFYVELVFYVHPSLFGHIYHIEFYHLVP